MRPVLLRLHRWIGLATALFLAVVGLTGATIVFERELDAWLNPDLFDAPRESRGAPVLAVTELIRRIEATDPSVLVTFAPLRLPPGRAAVFSVAPRPGGADLGYSQVFVDPATGRRLGTRQWGALRFDRRHAIPLLFEVHTSLELPGGIGPWLLGSVAVLWGLNSLAGFVLTLPRRASRDARAARGPGTRPFWSRWGSAWRIQRGSPTLRLIYDLHRAPGLWFALVFVTLAASGAYLQLGHDLLRPLVATVAPLSADPLDRKPPARDVERAGARTADDLAAILARARVFGAARGWPEPDDVWLDTGAAVYRVGFGDRHGAGLGTPHVFLDPDGRVLGTDGPGAGSVADRLLGSAFPVHSGQAAGIAGRVLILATGLALCVLSCTGVVLWVRRRAR